MALTERLHPPNKIPVMLHWMETEQSGWRDGRDYFVYDRKRKRPKRVAPPFAWSALTFGKGQYAEVHSLI